MMTPEQQKRAMLVLTTAGIDDINFDDAITLVGILLRTDNAGLITIEDDTIKLCGELIL